MIEVGQLAKIRRLHLREGMPMKEVSSLSGGQRGQRLPSLRNPVPIPSAMSSCWAAATRACLYRNRSHSMSNEIIAELKALKLHGMAQSYAEVTA